MSDLDRPDVIYHKDVPPHTVYIISGSQMQCMKCRSTFPGEFVHECADGGTERDIVPLAVALRNLGDDGGAA